MSVFESLSARKDVSALHGRKAARRSDKPTNLLCPPRSAVYWLPRLGYMKHKVHVIVICRVAQDAFGFCAAHLSSRQMLVDTIPFLLRKQAEVRFACLASDMDCDFVSSVSMLQDIVACHSKWGVGGVGSASSH